MAAEPHLPPVYRFAPNNSGIFCVGLDPREAAAVLNQGYARLDGLLYRVTAEGWPDDLDLDGRRTVRCEAAMSLPPLIEADPTDRWGLTRLLRLLRAA